MTHFSQVDYNKLVTSLDAALSVFQETASNPEAALLDFVENHYLKVWRSVSPSLPNGKEA